MIGTGALWAYPDHTSERERNAVLRAIFDAAQKGTHWMFLFDRESTQENEAVSECVRELCLLMAVSLNGGLMFLVVGQLDGTDTRHVLVMAIPKTHVTPAHFAAITSIVNSDNQQPADINDFLIVLDPDSRNRYPDIRNSPIYKLAMEMLAGTIKIPYTGPHQPSVN